MKIRLVLFDLDGTLLPMDQGIFTKAYFGGLARKLAPYGYEAEKLIDSIWAGTKAMVMNNGERINEDVFWDTFNKIYGRNAKNDSPYFEEFYRDNFDHVKDSCGYDPDAKWAVESIKDMGIRVALATNPIFPAIATESRIRWAGLQPSDFELYTTYENSRHCKPNLEYYKDILTELDVSSEECMMVGNDVDEDMIAEKLGMKVFLITECILNKRGQDTSRYPQGNFKDLIAYIGTLTAENR